MGEGDPWTKFGRSKNLKNIEKIKIFEKFPNDLKECSKHILNNNNEYLCKNSAIWSHFGTIFGVLSPKMRFGGLTFIPPHGGSTCITVSFIFPYHVVIHKTYTYTFENVQKCV